MGRPLQPQQPAGAAFAGPLLRLQLGSPPFSWSQGLPFFSSEVLQHRRVHRLVGYDALQLPVLVFKLLEPLRLAHFKAAVFGFSVVKRGVANGMLPTQIRHCDPRLAVLQNSDNLLFRKPALFHLSSPFFIQGNSSLEWLSLRRQSHIQHFQKSMTCLFLLVK